MQKLCASPKLLFNFDKDPKTANACKNSFENKKEDFRIRNSEGGLSKNL